MYNTIIFFIPKIHTHSLSLQPINVTASASTGVASTTLGSECEDTITLMVQWEVVDPDATATDKEGATKTKIDLGCAVYTSSWIA